MSFSTSLRVTSAGVVMAMVLSACATDLRSVQPSPEALYPESLLSCMDEPALEVRDDPRPLDEQVEYVRGLRRAYIDCKDTVEVDWAERRARYAEQYQESRDSGWLTWPFD